MQALAFNALDSHVHSRILAAIRTAASPHGAGRLEMEVGPAVKPLAKPTLRREPTQSLSLLPMTKAQPVNAPRRLQLLHLLHLSRMCIGGARTLLISPW